MSDREMDRKESGGGGGSTTPRAVSEAAVSDEPEKTQEQKDAELGSIVKQLVNHCKSSYINALYAFVPIALIIKFAAVGDALLFVTSFLGLIPLAAALGDFTEDLALRTNEAIGALINVTFGNATELIISIAALKYGEFELIKNSLVGSVLGNMLLVLGTAFVVGGMKKKLVYFSATAANTYMASLVFSSMGFIVPTAFFSLNSDSSDPHYALAISREVSILMVGMYGLYIWFQMKTHKELFEGPTKEEKAAREGKHNTFAVVVPELPSKSAVAAAEEGDVGRKEDAEDDDDDDEEEPQFTWNFAILALAVAAVLISALSDFMVESVEAAVEALHISKYFIGLVLIPIVGNVAEHASAIIMAAKGKLDISLGIALGSSIQIGMFAMPLLVLVAWAANLPLNMNVTPFTCACLFVSIVLTYTVVSGGNANYLTGAKMLAAYAMLTIAFLNAPDGGAHEAHAVADVVKATFAPRATA